MKTSTTILSLFVVTAALALAACSAVSPAVNETEETEGTPISLVTQGTPDLSQYYGESPPAARLIVGDLEQIAGIGTTTWTVKQKGDERTILHGDAFALVTPSEPLPVTSPFTATLALPIPEEPSILWYEVTPVTADITRRESDQGSISWEVASGESSHSLPLSARQEINFSLQPGEYVMEVFVDWQGLGNISYGFYFEVQGSREDLQTYTDPAGQFRVSFPADWKASEEEGVFQGSDGMLQSGYLPDMAFVYPITRVCERLANTFQGPARMVVLSPLPEADACRLVPYPEMNTDLVRLVVENAAGEPEQRYFFVEADKGHMDAIADSLELLNPPGEQAAFPYPTGPLRAEDQAFWESVSPQPEELTMEEHAVVEDSVDSPTHLEFNQRIPEDVFQKHAQWREATLDLRLASNNTLLEKFGYRLGARDGSETPLYDLYQDGGVLVGDISVFWPVSVSASGNDFAMLVEINNDGQQLVTKEGVQDWDGAASMFIPPVYYGEELIRVAWDPERSQVKVMQDEAQIYAFSAVFTVASPVKGLWSYGGNWLLEVDGFLIQDGENLNESLGYDEIFGWQLLNGKPFYYFRKGPRVGISYDGEALPVYYQEIVHYRCCEPAAFNNAGNQAMAWFYGLRDGEWYYVEMGEYP
jgi:hypothetical protein